MASDVVGARICSRAEAIALSERSPEGSTPSNKSLGFTLGAIPLPLREEPRLPTVDH
jgi:hypothetical protein